MLARKALAGTAGAPKEYVEDVFSTYLYTGTDATQTITNNIDLSTEGGLVWIKSRSAGSTFHCLFDTARGSTKVLYSNATNAESTKSDTLTAFNTSGFTLGADTTTNFVNAPSGQTHASWTFRKAKKFFDIVTYTGNGSTKTVNHNLGSTPGCVIIKQLNDTSLVGWVTYHRSVTNPNDNYLLLNTTGATASASGWISPGSSSFTVGNYGDINTNGNTYVAYLFAHDAGGFGDAGSDSIIKCGSYTGTGSNGTVIDLGWEPQWLLVKNADAAANWVLIDNMRGVTTGGVDTYLRPNTTNADDSTYDLFDFHATGFEPRGAFGICNAANKYIYIAIRRGPMKTPTSGTDVFYPQTISQADSIDSTGVPFPPDLVNTFSRDGTQRTTGYTLFQFADRLRSLGTPDDSYGTTKEGKALVSSGTDAEYGNLTNYSYIQLKADGRNITRSNGWNSASYGNWLNYFWRRAPGFFDVVCYTGTGSATTISHNLGVAPELYVVKRRNSTDDWWVYAAPLGNTKVLELNFNYASATDSTWNNTSPTSSVFSVGGTGYGVNNSGATYVAYLFASVSGVSKVGSYTGNGSNQTINCGFTNGARFILIKRTDSTGDWYVYDSARGIVSGNDPQLKLNSDVAEATGYDAVDPNNSGFIVNNDATNFPINVNNATYIYLAIA